MYVLSTYCLTTWTASLSSITDVFQLSGSPGGSQITCGCCKRKRLFFVCFLQNQPSEALVALAYFYV